MSDDELELDTLDDQKTALFLLADQLTALAEKLAKKQKILTIKKNGK